MAKTMDEDGTESKKLTKRVVVLTIRDNCRFLRDVYERAVVYILQNADQLTQIKLDWSSKDVIQHPNVIELLDILWDGFQQLFTLRYGYKDFVITKGLTKETYKSKRPPVHVSVAMKMRERGIEVPANSRIEYILLDNGIPYDKNELQNDKAVDVWHYAENKEELDIDYLYYFRSQFMKPLSELLKVVTHQTDIIESHFKYRIQKNYYINAMKSLYKTVIVYEEKECTWENTSLEEFIYKYSGMPIYYKTFFDRSDVKEEIQKISNHIKEEVQDGVIVYPRIDQVFRALSLSVKSIKVLLIGQDPYHNGNACGLAFSIENKDSDINPSLKNIIKECENCYFDMVSDSGDLSLWTTQSVMLLNTALTVRKGEANSPSKIWNRFTTLLIDWMISQHSDIIGLLWGRHAIDMGKHIDKKVCTSHPSPLGADKTCGEYPPFTGSKCFRQINALLSENNIPKIQWENRPRRVMLK
jgi:uracil-DNA glycosylase